MYCYDHDLSLKVLRQASIFYTGIFVKVELIEMIFVVMGNYGVLQVILVIAAASSMSYS